MSASVEIENTVKQIPILNWNLKIQRSGMIKKEYHSRRRDSLEIDTTQIMIKYKRSDISKGTERCQESLEIHNVIKVRSIQFILTFRKFIALVLIQMILCFDYEDPIHLYLLFVDNAFLLPNSSEIGDVAVNASIEWSYYPSLENNDEGI